MPATVSPVSGSLGSITTPTITSYVVTPEDGTTISQIVEKLNGVTLNTYNNPASLSRTFTVPQVNWDGITFWYSHTAEIIVTDSNGAVTTTTYTFVKALADNAPLLEGVAATEDAYELISDKRDMLASQAGLPAGSTFDEIISAIDTNLKKSASGTVVSDAVGDITVTGLDFQPSMIFAYSGTFVMYWQLNFNGTSENGYLQIGSITNNLNPGTTISPTGFKLFAPTSGFANKVFTWFAYE